MSIESYPLHWPPGWKKLSENSSHDGNSDMFIWVKNEVDRLTSEQGHH